MTSNPLVRMAELDIVPTRIDAYASLLAEEIEASIRLEPGVLSLSAVSLKDKPSQFRILEVYRDQAAYDAHLKSAHFLKYKSATAAMINTLSLFEMDPIMILTKSNQPQDSTNCK